MEEVVREKAVDMIVRCEDCGSLRVEERVFANVSVRADGAHNLAQAMGGLFGGPGPELFHPIEGAEFFYCRECGWTLMATRKTLEAIRKLENGEPVIGYKEGGNSMEPLISSMDPVNLMPVDPTKLEKGDIVLVRVHGKIYTHLVSALEPTRAQISNNHGKVNGWTPFKNVYGIVTHVRGNLKTKALRKVPQDVIDKLPEELKS